MSGAEPDVTDSVSDLRSRLQTGFLWSAVGAVFNQGSTLVVNVVVAHTAGTVVFGEYAAIQTTVATGAAIASFGTGYTATKYVAELRLVDRDRAGRVLGLCAVVACITAAAMALGLILAAGPIASTILRAPHLTTALRIAALALLFNVLNWFMMGALAGLEAYRSLAVTGILSGTGYLLLCSAGAWFGGLEGALVGVVASAALQSGLLAGSLRLEGRRQGIRLQPRGFWSERPVLWRFALPSAIPGFTTMPSYWLASLVLLRQPGGYVQMAYYAAANSFRVAILFLPSIFSTVNMSVLNSQLGVGDERQYRRVLRNGVLVAAAVALLGAGAVAALAGPLLRLFGPTFDAGRGALLVLLAAALFETLWTVISQAVASRERMWALLLGSTLPRDALVILLAVILVPRFLSVGLASAYALAWMVALCLVTLLARRPRRPAPRSAALSSELP